VVAEVRHVDRYDSATDQIVSDAWFLPDPATGQDGPGERDPGPPARRTGRPRLPARPPPAPLRVERERKGGAAVIAIVVAAGLGIGGGALLLASGLRKVEPTAQRSQSSLAEARRRFAAIDGRRVALAAAGAVVSLLLVRWPVAVAAGAAAGWAAPSLGDRAARRRVEARTDAIAQWCEMLRDAAGTARGIEGILAATATSAPEPIRPELARMSRDLQREPLTTVLDHLAVDLAHPIGDLIVTALRVAANAGSRRIAGVMANLAEAAHHEASMRRRLEVARARPRATLRLVVAIVAVFVGGLVLFARDYMAPYGSPLGQVVLVFVGAYWAMGFWWMSRLGHVPEVERTVLPTGTGTAGLAR